VELADVRALACAAAEGARVAIPRRDPCLVAFEVGSALGVPVRAPVVGPNRVFMAIAAVAFKAVKCSQFYLHWLWLDDVPHLRTWLRWLEGSEHSVGSRNLDFWRHVRVGTRQCRALDAVERQLLLKQLALAAFFVVDLLTGLVASKTIPDHL